MSKEIQSIQEFYKRIEELEVGQSVAIQSRAVEELTEEDKEEGLTPFQNTFVQRVSEDEYYTTSIGVQTEQDEELMEDYGNHVSLEEVMEEVQYILSNIDFGEPFEFLRELATDKKD